jgi:hypothetical protein
MTSCDVYFFAVLGAAFSSCAPPQVDDDDDIDFDAVQWQAPHR